jgi:hypothetical protein
VELGAKLQNDDYHCTSWLVQELQQNAWTMKYGHLRQHLRDSEGNTASLLMRTACQVSETECRLPGISPCIEFRVYIPLLAGVSSDVSTNTLPYTFAPAISPKRL